MSRLKSWFAPPPSGKGPAETLRWVRRMEITFGIALLAGAAVTWSNDWGSWVLLGMGLLGLSPWPGASAILRRAETRPEILVSDPERRKHRGSQAAKTVVPIQVAIATGLGYFLLGWEGAILLCVLAAAGSALGVWLYLKVES